MSSNSSYHIHAAALRNTYHTAYLTANTAGLLNTYSAMLLDACSAVLLTHAVRRSMPRPAGRRGGPGRRPQLSRPRT
jgi:hypothetical protein